jgi:uncharacterized protein
MSNELSLHLPEYATFIDSIAVLALPVSGSELHGMLCGYLCAGAASEGEAYIRALMTNKKGPGFRNAALALFGVYGISQQQLANFNFEFELLIPEDSEQLPERAKAFSEWCEGFVQGMTLSGIGFEQLQEEETQEALQHLTEFAELDYQSLHIDEEDEQALMEVTEYARMAVLRIYADLHTNNSKKERPETTH